MGKYSIFIAFMLLLLVWNSLWLAAPFLAKDGSEPAATTLYAGLAPFCHQLPQRSLCVIESSTGALSIGDCISQTTQRISRYTTADERGTAYQFGVCARDMAIYLAMLIGGIAYYFINRRNLGTDNIPPIWILVLFLVPMGLDGGTQFIGLRESTNFLRLLTGAIAGIIVPFYAIPVLNYFLPVMKRAFFSTSSKQ